MILEWLARPNVAKWMDFGDGRTTINEGQFRFMVRNPANRVNLYCDTASGAPVGLIALQGIRNTARVGHQWGLRGNFKAGDRLVSVHAIYCNLDLAFRNLGQQAVQAWCVASNRPSLMVSHRAGFKDIGRARRTHFMDGELHDRVWMDITAEEWAEMRQIRLGGGAT